MGKMKFRTEDGRELEVSIEEQTRLGGTDYILVTDGGEDADAYILKDISESTDEDAEYVMVTDDDELDAIIAVFEELMEDTEILR